MWKEIQKSLLNKANTSENFVDHQGYLGHADCTRFIQGLVVRDHKKQPVFHPLFRGNNSPDQDFLYAFLQQFGGISTRTNNTNWAYFKLFCSISKKPMFIINSLLPFIVRKLQTLQSMHGYCLIWRYLLGQNQINYLNIISHHFMNSEQIDTAQGQERISACVFKVPIDDKMVSMCEVNAKGYREKYYAQLKNEQIPMSIQTKFKPI